MFDLDQYQLLDFGDGRRLERAGPLLLDRPCPAADSVAKAAPPLWAAADARFESDQSGQGQSERGRWAYRGEPPACWSITHEPLVFELKRTAFGHIGLFPEQAENWDWIARQVAAAKATLRRPPKVLNLFAYTGGSTLAAAAAGAEVTHVDAARNVVAWARRNAELSGMAQAPIRWIAEDAAKFVERELRRGKRYDAVILDPPTYGHGAGGESWQLTRNLPSLLDLCGQLITPSPLFILLTCHTPGYSPDRLRSLLAAVASWASPGVLEAADLDLSASTGHRLPSGSVARWSGAALS